MDAAYNANNRSDEAGWTFVKDALRAAGYDALRYSNLIEDAGSESFIVLEAEQIAPSDADAPRPSMGRP